MFKIIVIIEGPDLSGKTYAIEKIAKHFNSGFILKNAFKPSTILDNDKIYTQYWRILRLIYSFDSNQLIILDRFYPSQAIYSIFRGTDAFYHHEIHSLDRYCHEKGIKLILLNTDVKTLEKRYEDRGDEHIKKEQLRLLKKRYNIFSKYTKLPILKIDTRTRNWLKKVEKFLKIEVEK